MNIPFRRKHLLIVALTLGVAAGCATTPPDTAGGAPKAEAMSAVAQAIADAKAAIATAKSLNWVWRDTSKFLKQAEKAAAAGDDAKAIKLAKKAQAQAEEAVNQYYIEKAKPLLQEAQSAANLTNAQSVTLRSAAAALANGEGRKAYDLLTGLAAELRGDAVKYTVIRGDSLWGISARPETYNNPYQWPLIYKANRDQIKDADLIYPGQVFSVNRGASAAEVDAAVRHAKTRGAWSIGVVEDSDRAYLGGSLQLR